MIYGKLRRLQNTRYNPAALSQLDTPAGLSNINHFVLFRRTVVKPIKTKAQTRDEINQQINDFLQTGGKVNEIQRGVSGRDLGQNLALPISMERTTTASRTLVNDEIAAIEARRKSKQKTAQKLKPSKPQKKLIVDDFGEPVRWVWVDPNDT